MSAEIKASVVVAVEHSARNLPAILRALAPEEHPTLEVLICCAGGEAPVLPAIEDLSNVRALQGGTAARIPHLWRDGILAARGPLVATLTAHCIPEPGWAQRVLELDMQDDIAGVGGLICNHREADGPSWAIFLQRYVRYAPPQRSREVEDVAADNAVYRRAQILQYPDLLAQGFWEPSFHTLFRQNGCRLRIDPDLLVTHRNRYPVWQFFSQRVTHGSEFGYTRARRLGLAKRLLLTGVSPLLPILFLRKILSGARRHPECKKRIWTALPWLLLFVAGWGIGESKGYIRALAPADA